MNTEKPEVTTEKHMKFFSDFLRKSFTENKKNENNTEKKELYRNGSYTINIEKARKASKIA